jgi:hypothetical protein
LFRDIQEETTKMLLAIWHNIPNSLIVILKIICTPVQGQFVRVVALEETRKSVLEDTHMDRSEKIKKPGYEILLKNAMQR